jgi:drug/metabolite transporter (DMT)-like permease
MISQQFDKKAYLFIVGAALVFGSFECALKPAGNIFDPFQLTFFRFAIGGLVLLPFAIKECRGRPKGFITGRIWFSMLFLGILIVVCCTIIFQVSLYYLNAATAAVVFCVNPVFIMAFAHLMTADDKMNRNKLYALALGAFGLVFMVRPWDVQEGNSAIGALLALSSAVIFALYTVAGGKTVGRVGIFTQTSASFLLGSLVLLCIMLPMGRPFFTGIADHPAVILYTSVVMTGFGYVLFFLAIKNSNASTAGIVFFLKPVIAPVFAVIILGETITWTMFIGIALILAASYILTFRRKARQSA